MSDWFTADAALQATLQRDLHSPWREIAGELLPRVALAARDRVTPLAWLSDRHAPTLRTHDPFGERIDEICYHPAYREMERIAYDELALVAMKHDGRVFDLPQAAPQTLGFAALYLFAQGETGLCSPLLMTDGAARVITRYGDEGLRRDLLPRLCARGAPGRLSAAWFIAEKGGGSDLGQVSTTATPDNSGWRITGDKWFCSNVDAGVLLVTARALQPGGADEGPLCLFVVEPLLPDGRKNGMLVHRLKDKLGTRSVPTGEVSFNGAWARMIGAPDDTPKILAELQSLARLHHAVVSVALMRRAVQEALGWLSLRHSFGRRLIDQPLIIEALADLLCESHGAFHLVFDAVRRLGLMDEGFATATDRRVLRLLAPLCKYYAARLSVWAASECIELHGGNGYIEEFVSPRLLRDAQALPLLEGTTNLCILEVVRVLTKPGTAEALCTEAERKLVGVSHPRLRPLAEQVRRHQDRLTRSLGRLTGFSDDAMQHHARQLTDALVQNYEVALSLAESDRLEDLGQGGRDYLTAERLLARHLERPSLETMGPRHIDPLRLQVLIGDRASSVAEVA